jgi:hypothetical protein
LSTTSFIAALLIFFFVRNIDQTADLPILCILERILLQKDIVFFGGSVFSIVASTACCGTMQKIKAR